MAKRRRRASRKVSGFGIGLLIYAWILIAVGGAALFLLHNYLAAYEDSQPGYCVEAYQKALGDTVPDAARHALDDLDPLVLGEEARVAFIRPLLQEVSLVKDESQSRETHLVYEIDGADGRPLGSVIFEPVGQTVYQLPVWGPVEEHFDFSSYYVTTGVTVPADYQVYLGDLLLGQDCIAERDIPYEQLREFYPNYRNLPTLVRYESVPFVGQVPLRVLDEKGREVTEDRLTEEVFLDRCPAEIREQADQFVPEFIRLYVLFSADVNHSANFYFDQLRPYILKDSELYTRLRQAFEGLGYNLQIRSCSLESLQLNRVTDLGEGRYLADIDYSLLIDSHGSDPVETHDHVLLVLVNVGGVLQASALYYQ